MAQVILTLAFGVLVGLSLSLVGGGGSILTVPILVYVLGENIHLATGTALAIVGANALIGAWLHGRAGHVRLAAALLFGGAGILGALVGSWLNQLAPGRVLLVGFALLMLVAAAAMVQVRRGERAEAQRLRLSPRVALAGLVVGVLTGFFGVGGGFLIVPTLVLVLDLPMCEAVGTSLAVIVINTAAALIGHLRFGGIDLEISILFIIGGIGGSMLGSRLCGHIDDGRLRQMFSGLVVFVALYILARTLAGHAAA